MSENVCYTLIEKNVVDPHKQIIYDALRPVVWFEPTIMTIADMIRLKNSPIDDGIYMTVNVYNQRVIDKTIPKGIRQWFLVKKKNMLCGYLFYKKDDILPEKVLDEEDKEFIVASSDRTKFDRYEFYGLHIYHTFFHPDLEEVINLIYPWWSALITKPSIIYVTTEAHPSSKVSAFYDSTNDRHQAKTTVWIPKN